MIQCEFVLDFASIGDPSCVDSHRPKFRVRRVSSAPSPETRLEQIFHHPRLWCMSKISGPLRRRRGFSRFPESLEPNVALQEAVRQETFKRQNFSVIDALSEKFNRLRRMFLSFLSLGLRKHNRTKVADWLFFLVKSEFQLISFCGIDSPSPRHRAPLREFIATLLVLSSRHFIPR